MIKNQSFNQRHGKFSETEQKTIEEAAQLLIREYENTVQREVFPPIPVELIAESVYDLKIYKTVTEEGIPGQLNLNQKCLILNLADSLQRQKFTVAHELGHIKLHYIPNLNCFRKDKSFDRKEIEANQFAGTLLIPQKFLYEHLILELIELVKRFKISGFSCKNKKPLEICLFPLNQLN